MRWPPWRKLTADEQRERHNLQVARNGHGLIILPTNVSVPESVLTIGGLPPPAPPECPICGWRPDMVRWGPTDQGRDPS